MKNLFIALFICTVLLSCSPQPESTDSVISASDTSQDSPIEALADEYFEAMLDRFPTYATSVSLPGAKHDRLFDNSPEAQVIWEQREDAWLTRLDTFEAPIDANSRDWVTYGLLYEELASSAATRVCRSALWNASETTGWHVDMPAVFDIQPLDTPELKLQALARLDSVAAYIDQ